MFAASSALAITPQRTVFSSHQPVWSVGGLHRLQRWEHFHRFDVSLPCDESKLELEIDDVEIPVPPRPMQPAFITPAEMTASPPEDGDISSVSAFSASHGSATLTSVRQEYQRVMTIGWPPPLPF